MIGKVNVAFRYWLSARIGTGAPATGIASGDFTIAVRNSQDSATMASPTVTEVGGGLYHFDILAAFTNTHGAGQYGVNIEVDSTTPKVRDTGGGQVEFFVQDLDDVAIEANVEGHAADALTAYDPPTRVEATADKDEILIETTAIGVQLQRVLGLTQENYKLENITYNSNGDLLTATAKIYPSAADLDAGTNVIATYNIVATYDAQNQLTDYEFKKV